MELLFVAGSSKPTTADDSELIISSTFFIIFVWKVIRILLDIKISLLYFVDKFFLIIINHSNTTHFYVGLYELTAPSDRHDLHFCFLDSRIPSVLMFATGSRSIPPMDFHNPSSIAVLQNTSVFPNANT